MCLLVAPMRRSKMSKFRQPPTKKMKKASRVWSETTRENWKRGQRTNEIMNMNRERLGHR